jgi:hypothetical protein
MTTKDQFKLHLESQSCTKTGKSASYVSALDLLSQMLHAVPKGFLPSNQKCLN